MEAAHGKVEVQRQGVVQAQLVAARDAAAHQVALPARGGQLVVE